MVEKFLVVYCCLFLVKVVQSLIDSLLKLLFKRKDVKKDCTKECKSMNTLEKRQYEVLKHLKEYQEQRIKNSNYKKLGNIILHDGFYDSIDFEKFEVNTVLKELHDGGYIYDVANAEPKFTDIHTCKSWIKGLTH